MSRVIQALVESLDLDQDTKQHLMACVPEEHDPEREQEQLWACLAWLEGVHCQKVIDLWQCHHSQEATISYQEYEAACQGLMVGIVSSRQHEHLSIRQDTIVQWLNTCVTSNCVTYDTVHSFCPQMDDDEISVEGIVTQTCEASYEAAWTYVRKFGHPHPGMYQHLWRQAFAIGVSCHPLVASVEQLLRLLNSDYRECPQVLINKAELYRAIEYSDDPDDYYVLCLACGTIGSLCDMRYHKELLTIPMCKSQDDHDVAWYAQQFLAYLNGQEYTLEGYEELPTLWAKFVLR